MFGLAYRMLGSAQEAEDVVQDAFLRWNGAAHDAIGVPSAWLAKVVTNLCLNRLTSARVQREQYIGTWLPEPVLTSGGALGPMETAEQRESVSLAFLVLLERLTPTERAVFVLREAFGYSHREIAEIAGLTEANSRQLHRRARQQLNESPKRSSLDRGHWRDLVERFLAAARAGDLRGLEQLLAADVTSWADGGGKSPAARRPVVGRMRVARYLTGAMGKLPAGVQVAVAEVNGEPAVLGWLGGRVFGAGVLEIRDGQISALRIIANPSKLGFAARQAVALSDLALSDLALSDLGLSHPDGPVGS
jgi:RNA polymerase sigma-70 factor (ECF subfamily)